MPHHGEVRADRAAHRRARTHTWAALVVLSVGLLAACGTGSPATGTEAHDAPAASATSAGSTSAGGSVTPTVAPPYVSQARWVNASRGRSLHIFPTDAGRTAQGSAASDEAWAEVVRIAPDASQPGMRAQFDCHWTYARLLEPDKVSWNIEPWRPVVSAGRMVETGCNPGGAESDEN